MPNRRYQLEEIAYIVATPGVWQLNIRVESPRIFQSVMSFSEWGISRHTMFLNNVPEEERPLRLEGTSPTPRIENLRLNSGNGSQGRVIIQHQFDDGSQNAMRWDQQATPQMQILKIVGNQIYMEFPGWDALAMTYDPSRKVFIRNHPFWGMIYNRQSPFRINKYGQIAIRV